MSQELSIARHTAAGKAFSTWSDIYDTCSPHMYGIIYGLTQDHSMSEDILKLIFLELKEDLVALAWDPSRFASVLKLTHELTVEQLREMRIPLSGRRVKLYMTSLLATPFSSIGDVAELFGLSEAEAKKQLREEMLSFRKEGSGMGGEQENYTEYTKRIGETLSINELLFQLKTKHYPPLRSV
jgi:hypothetical protein